MQHLFWLQNHVNIIFDTYFQTKNIFLTIGNDSLCIFKKDFERKKFLRVGTFKASEQAYIYPPWLC